MTQINIDDSIHATIKKLTEDYSIDYPSVKNYINRVLREELKRTNVELIIVENKKEDNGERQ